MSDAPTETSLPERNLGPDRTDERCRVATRISATKRTELDLDAGENVKSHCFAGAFECAQGDSNSHGPYGPQGPQPCAWRHWLRRGLSRPSCPRFWTAWTHLSRRLLPRLLPRAGGVGSPVRTVESALVAMKAEDENERWQRNERARRRVLERDRRRPANELLAEAIEVSRVAMKLRAGATKSPGA